jgi:hypothetical protein
MAELQSNINAITSQSVIGGEQIAVNAVYCTGWPIVATDVFAGKQHDTFRKLFQTDRWNRTIWRRYGESHPLYQQYYGPCMSNPEVSTRNGLKTPAKVVIQWPKRIPEIQRS